MESRSAAERRCKACRDEIDKYDTYMSKNGTTYHLIATSSPADSLANASSADGLQIDIRLQSFTFPLHPYFSSVDVLVFPFFPLDTLLTEGII